MRTKVPLYGARIHIPFYSNRIVIKRNNTRKKENNSGIVVGFVDCDVPTTGKKNT